MVLPAGTATPVTVVRLYDDNGAAWTSGFSEELVDMLAGSCPDEKIFGGPVGVVTSGSMIAPPSGSAFRFNIGVRTLEQDVGVTFKLIDPATGAEIAKADRTYPPNYFEQVAATDLFGDRRYPALNGANPRFRLSPYGYRWLRVEREGSRRLL